jgi:HK97 family phage major capsid protein
MPPIQHDAVDALIDAIEERLVARVPGATSSARTSAGRNLYGGTPANRGASKSLGEQFVEGESYRTWLKSYPEGAPSAGQAMFAPPMSVRAPISRLGMRAIVTSADASAGSLIAPDDRGLLDAGAVRPASVLSLVTHLSTQSDAPTFAKETSRTSAAAPVAEADQLAHTGDETATKPEGAIAWEQVEVLIKTFALWVPATKRSITDAPQLKALIDTYLPDDLRIELEDQILAGNGGEGFVGVLNDPDTQPLGPPAGDLSEVDLLRRAIRMVTVTARTKPTAIVCNPADAERWDTLKDLEERYLLSDPTSGAGQTSLWGVPVVETDACPAGTAVLGDFRRAVVFDREQTTISVGTANEDFIRNIIRVLAELRAGFILTRPSAFVIVDLGSGS